MQLALPLDDRPSAPARCAQLFWAILPDPAAALLIRDTAGYWRARHGLAGGLIDARRLHISLLPAGSFSGEIPSRYLEALGRAASTVNAGAFPVTLDRAMSFRGSNPPYVLTGDAGLAALQAFRATLADALSDHGLGCSRRAVFTPHLTLLYGDAVVPSHAIAPVTWTVREFALIQSCVGESRYLLHHRCPLRG